MRTCPVCASPLVEPMGPVKSKLILVGGTPGDDELDELLPWVGKAGEVLQNELSRAGIAWGTVRVTNLWLHRVPGKKVDTFDRCREFCLGELMKELVGRKAVLLMGTEVVNLFTGFGSSLVSSMRVQCADLPGAELVVASVNPTEALKDKVGETRLAISNFARWSKKMGLR